METNRGRTVELERMNKGMVKENGQELNVAGHFIGKMRSTNRDRDSRTRAFIMVLLYAVKSRPSTITSYFVPSCHLLVFWGYPLPLLFL